jgi:hypothetical protein
VKIELKTRVEPDFPPFHGAAQLARDVSTHCMLAEAAARIGHLEERVTKLRHDEMITQVWTGVEGCGGVWTVEGCGWVEGGGGV